MRAFVTAILVAACAVPAAAQPGYDYQNAPGYGGDADRRWSDAQARYRAETDRYNAEWRAYQAARGDRGGMAPPPGEDDAYDAPDNGRPPYARAPDRGGYAAGAYSDDRDENGYDPSRYYRAGGGYREHALAADDRVYAGSDGRYYCRRNDGTTGLIVGAASGGILGNIIDGGHSRAAGTLIGGALGALAGRSIDQNQQQIRCR